jgi:hypothetical protein
MRKTLTAWAGLSAALILSACGDREPGPAPETYKPSEASTVMPDDAPPQEEAVGDAEASPVAAGSDSPAACATTLGAAKAADLVKRCIAVSPATHPPCNAANPCEMIQGEIDRSCAMYGPDEAKPAECAG